MPKELKLLAYRDEPMTEEEVGRVAELTQAYWRDYEDNDKYSGPRSYLEDDGPVFAAALTVPDGDAETGFLEYWLTWLTEITRELKGTRWTVELDGAPLKWDELEGWSVYRS